MTHFPLKWVNWCTPFFLLDTKQRQARANSCKVPGLLRSEVTRFILWSPRLVITSFEVLQIQIYIADHQLDCCFTHAESAGVRHSSDCLCFIISHQTTYSENLSLTVATPFKCVSDKCVDVTCMFLGFEVRVKTMCRETLFPLLTA